MDEEEVFFLDDIVEPELECVPHSPFSYQKGMRAVLLNKNKSASLREIFNYFDFHKLEEKDLVVLECMYKHPYITRYTLTKILAMSPEKEIRNSYKKTLSKMLKQGVIQGYVLTWFENNMDRQTPVFYTLSPGGVRFMDKYNNSGSFINWYPFHTNSKDLPKDILEMGSINAFHLSIMRQQRLKVIHYNLFFNAIIDKKRSVCIPAIYRVPLLFCEKKFADLVVFSIRGNDSAYRELFQKLTLMEKYKQTENSLLTEPLYIFLMESSERANMLEWYLSKRNFVKFPHLYVLDKDLLNEEFLSTLFIVNPNEDGGYTMDVSRAVL